MPEPLLEEAEEAAEAPGGGAMTAPATAAQPMPGTGARGGATASRAGLRSIRSPCSSGSTPSTSSARFAFGVLLPNIRDDFGLSPQGVLTVVAFGFVGALVLALPIGFWGDRFNRILLIVIAGILLGTFSILTGLAISVVMFVIARAGSELGAA